MSKYPKNADTIRRMFHNQRERARNHILITSTFRQKISGHLPTIKEIKKWVATDEYDNHMDSYKMLKTYDIREAYNKRSFPILSHDFFERLNQICKGYRVADVACGSGWLSRWARHYGINVVKLLDNSSWKIRRLKEVEVRDATRFVKRADNIDIFILSWPPMDDMAYKVWNNMKEGQILLYIGEEFEGCNADERFFKSVSGHRVDHTLPFVSFYGVHDRPMMFRKGERE